MAGPHPQTPARSPFADPVLAARLDALKQLADGVSDRVAVMDREFNVVYANAAAWESGGLAASLPKPAKCYEALVHLTEPCEDCPATRVFETREECRVSCRDGGDGTPCGMRQATPLMSGAGEVGSVLVLFHQHRAEVPPRVPVRLPAPQTVSTKPERTTTRLGDLVGVGPEMQQLFDMIKLVADSAATVLLQGESGTGKELVAKTIHRTSYRRSRPFVVVDCGALPETLLESELFGHVKGAFTGATVSKPGLFEEADGGTIFLDEIADTSPMFQAKLLRVLQEGEIKRVGGTQPIKVDVRVISASNKDLADLVAGKTFRQDLYYRLAVLPIYLPPLRERRGDIPMLVEQFLLSSCARHHQPPRRVSSEAMGALITAPWPGNVRELQHAIERAVVTTDSVELTCADVLSAGSHAGHADLRTAVRGAARQIERTKILQALEQTSGNRVKAARLLKISRASLYNKLQEFEL